MKSPLGYFLLGSIDIFIFLSIYLLYFLLSILITSSIALARIFSFSITIIVSLTMLLNSF